MLRSIRYVFARIFEPFIIRLPTLLKTSAYALFWRFRPVSIDFVWEKELDAPHRQLLAREISRVEPETILEFGCGAAQNLAIINKLCRAEMTGIDLNRDRIALGKQKLLQYGINGHLCNGGIQYLENMHTEQYDISFSCATLMYIGDDGVRQCLRELIRISKKALYLLEFHDPDMQGWQSRSTVDGFIRNYANLMLQFGKESEIIKIPSGIVPAFGAWPSYAHLIKVECQR